MKINEVSRLTGLTVKTLQHFDTIGLLSPIRNLNGYRNYNESDIIKLQTILFFRELDFPLKRIKEILSSESFNLNAALKDQIKLLEIKQKRINSIIELAKKNLGDEKMRDISVFNNNEFKKYESEVKEKWGNTNAYKESKSKLRNQSDEEIKKTGDDMMDIFRRFGLIKTEPINQESLNLVEELQQFITDHYYKCDNKILLGLASMYITDERFKTNIDKEGGIGTAEFVNSCIIDYLK